MTKRSTTKRVILKQLLVILLLVLVLILNAGGILTYSLVRKRADFNSLEKPEEYGVSAENIILTTSDNFKIDSYLVDVNDPKGYIIILSGIYSPSVTFYFGYAKMFKDLGYSSLLVEMRAHGRSDGDKIMLSYTEERDVNAAVAYINSIDGDIPVIVFGTSMGGSVAINSIANNSRIDGVISQSAFSSWEENIMDQFESYGVPSFLAKSQVPFTRLLLGFKYGFKNITNTPGNNIDRISPEKMFLLHSKGDSQVKIQNLDRLMCKLTSDVDTYVVDGDKHFIVGSETEFLNPTLDIEYYERIKAFLKKFY